MANYLDPPCLSAIEYNGPGETERRM
uniref:Uncharacterized protein n=1 Tax=Tetranychus urticae TaxID=32264 RepID=T1KIX8_TETUR